jgi:TMEM199 family protein
MITPSLVLNIFMSVILCGFATFWALKNFQTPSFLSGILLSPTGKRDRVNTGATMSKDPVFVLISMFVGILVGVAETVVYAAYVRKVKYAKDAEKKVKERKEVVSSVEVGWNDESSRDVDGEEEVIWGKGVNGGVRRRVREKWENANDDSQ